MLLIVSPPRVGEVNYTMPIVGSRLTVTCTAEFPPDLPRNLYLLPFPNSTPFDSSDIVDDGPTSRTIVAVLDSVELNSTLQYICIAEVEDRDYVYARPNSSNRVINLTSICKPSVLSCVCVTVVKCNSAFQCHRHLCKR